MSETVINKAENIIQFDIGSILKDIKDKSGLVSMEIPAEEFRALITKAVKYDMQNCDKDFNDAQKWRKMPEHAQNFFKDYSGDPYYLHQ